MDHGIPRNQKVYACDVQLALPGSQAPKLVPDHEPQAAKDVLTTRLWRRVTRKFYLSNQPPCMSLRVLAAAEKVG